MDSYEKLLENAMSKIKVRDKTERFEIPQIESLIEGNQTIIKNFIQICNVLKRESNHLMKYLTKETAAPGSVSEKRLTLQAKVPGRVLRAKLEKYVNEFVFCPVCKRPDTKLLKEDRLIFMKCEACGAKTSVRKI